jgi:hypothetical protein
MTYIEDLLGAHGYPPEEENEVLIDIRILTKTNKAMLIRHKNRQAWFPNSVILLLKDNCLEYMINFDPTWKQVTQRRRSPIEGNF